MAYDDQALYVAACLYDSETEKITSRLSRRDDFGESDWFVFCVDPYLDRRTGFSSPSTPPLRSATGRCKTTPGATAPGTATGRPGAASMMRAGWWK